MKLKKELFARLQTIADQTYKELLFISAIIVLPPFNTFLPLFAFKNS